MIDSRENEEERSMIWNIPNVLTLLRVLFIPVVIMLYLRGEQGLALVFLIFSLLTDFLDGRLARALGQETHFGAIFDPIADKFVAMGYYSLIAYLQAAPLWFISIILVRNFAQFLSVPLLIVWLKRSFSVKPSFFAKFATAVSDLFLFVPLYFVPFLEEQDFLHDTDMEAVIYTGIGLAALGIAVMELRILITYLPRLIGIARGTHDTFV